MCEKVGEEEEEERETDVDPSAFGKGEGERMALEWLEALLKKAFCVYVCVPVVSMGQSSQK